MKPRKGPWPKGLKVCVFANGCFWGSEKGIWRLPGGGIFSTAVGYAGGYTPNPTYEEACSGRTGHTEAVQVVFDPEKISLVDILRWFWEAHDPTQGFLNFGGWFRLWLLGVFFPAEAAFQKTVPPSKPLKTIQHLPWLTGMGQGNDRGTQYRSALYYFDEEQRQLYEASCTAYEQALKAKGKGRGKITTEIKAAKDFPEARKLRVSGRDLVLLEKGFVAAVLWLKFCFK